METIYNRSVIRLGWMDRIRIAFGKDIIVNTEITVDRPIEIISSTAYSTVHPFFMKERKCDLTYTTT